MIQCWISLRLPKAGFSSTFSQRVWAASSAWLPWVYDTVVIVLVIYKSFKLRRYRPATSSGFNLTRALVTDGLLYYRWADVSISLDARCYA